MVRMKAAFSTLVPLWRAKYGDQWVQRKDFDYTRTEDQKLYAGVLHRLEMADYFERVDGWVRLKEDV